MSHSMIRRFALTATGAVGAFALATPRLLRLGATKEEARRPMPGDDEVPKAHIQGTRAVTIDAPPEEVWPWTLSSRPSARRTPSSAFRATSSGSEALDALNEQLLAFEVREANKRTDSVGDLITAEDLRINHGLSRKRGDR